MNKLLLSTLACAFAFSAKASTTLDVRGNVYAVDTVYHAVVGPGTTQTQLRLTYGAYPLDVFYLTIDRTTPGVSIRAVCANDKVASCATTTNMAKSKTKAGVAYFAGANADFFTTSGTATNGSSKVGTPTCTTIVDGEIYKTSNSNYQFTIDADGVARVCRLNYYTGTAKLGDNVTLYKGVNVMSPNNGITIYTPRFWGSANQNDYADACWQVTAKLVDGDKMVAGRSYRMVVTSEPTADGDLAIPADGYVIHGRGTSTSGCNTSAVNFVGALHVGDIVEFDNIVLTPEGERIYPVTAVSGNPKNVGNGETLDSEGERADASARHPRTSIGYSEDGSKVIMMVIDGRTNSSVGVTTSMLADVMRFAGAYEAVNLDGGGSSTLYTQALGVRNHCSDGSERAVGNAIFVVLEAPEDNEIATIRFADWAKTMPAYGMYTPVIYGYNQYGKLIDTEVKGFALSSDAGSTLNDGTTFMANTPGMHALTATYNGMSCSIPVTITAAESVTPVYASVLIDDNREWQVQLQSSVDGEMMPVAAEAFSWSSSDANVATVTTDGHVKGIANGECTLTGVGPCTVEQHIKVELAPAEVYAVEPTNDATLWTISKSAMKTVEISQLDNGLVVDFQQSSTRGPRITASLKQNMVSLPKGVQIRINPGETPITSITVNLMAANDTRPVAISKDVELTANAESTIKFDLNEFFDTTDIGIYPVQFTSVGFVPNGNTSTVYHVEMPGIEALYDAPAGVDNITVDKPINTADSTHYDLLGRPISQDAPGMHITRNGKILKK